MFTMLDFVRNSMVCTERASIARSTVPIANGWLLATIGCFAALGCPVIADETFAEFFANCPANSLVGQLESPPPNLESLPAGQLRRSFSPLAPGVLQIHGQLEGAGLAANLPEVPLLDLCFRVRGPRAERPFTRLAFRNDQWYGSAYWSGPNWTRVGRDWHHPGEKTPSVRCFVAPREGQATIRGRVRKLHLDGDGVRATLLHNDREVWSAEIEGKDDQGLEPQVTLDLRRGDTLRFVIHKRGQIFCDTTHWDPIVRFADGTTYQASAAFSSTQGEGGWFYEMLGDDAEPAPPLLLYAWSSDLVQCDFTLSDQEVVLTGSEHLPLVVIADPLTRSGLALVIDTRQPWSCSARHSAEGRLQVVVRTPSARMDLTEGRPSTDSLAPVVLAAFEGPWTAGIASLMRTLDGGRAPQAAASVQQAYNELARAAFAVPEPELLLVAQSEWKVDDRLQETPESYAAAVGQQLERVHTLLEDLNRQLRRREELRTAAKQLAAEVSGADETLQAQRRLYLRTRLLKRAALLSDELVGFRHLLFCKRKPPSYSHLVGQYYGWRQRAGGGLFVLDDFGRSLRCRDVLAQSLPPGSILEPRLSYDAQRILFSFVACSPTGLPPDGLVRNEEGQEEAYFHVYEVHTDGTGLRQLTAGAYDDLMAEYLPDGGIVFCSTRRRGYSRCFGPQFSERWDSYTLHRMNSDGDGLRPISVNDVNEWFPAVSNSGHLLFARWDYIDRDAVTHQNLWAARPDGANPVAVWGNATAAPHCSFQARPIPGSAKIMFIASAHHALTAGPVCIVDPAIDANSSAALRRVTPGPFPEAESMQIAEYYQSPWPLSESLFLAAYSRDRLRFEGEHVSNPNPDNALGIYLMDDAGNRELIYRDPEISSTTPIPLQPRPCPPVVTSSPVADLEGVGEMLVADVYQGLGDIPRGSIKELRVVQIFPKTTPWANSPRIGIAGEENARAILGAVPVEADGSVRFLLPADKPVLFQALDADGQAYQTMRSTTYVQAGERTACIGCHEPSASVLPPRGAMPLALARPPSNIEPGMLGGKPFSYAEVVQPILDRHCISCHGVERLDGNLDLTSTPHEGFTKSYWSLCRSDEPSAKAAAAPANLLVPRYPQRNQIQKTEPGGAIGARGSRLMKLLREEHEGVRLSGEELRCIAAWIDLNAVFYGAYQPADVARQLRGEPIAMPRIQ